MYHLRVTVTLTSDLVFLEKSCPEHISYIIIGRNPKSGVWMQFLMGKCHIPFLGHFDLDLICRIIVSRTYHLYYLRWESQFAVWIHLWKLMCGIPILGHCDLDL